MTKDHSPITALPITDLHQLPYNPVHGYPLCLCFEVSHDAMAEYRPGQRLNVFNVG
jgi:hypothetical protein